MQRQRELEQGRPAKKSDKEEFEAERTVLWEEEDYMKAYFKREKQVSAKREVGGLKWVETSCLRNSLGSTRKGD